jgi:hypothetical protein
VGYLQNITRFNAADNIGGLLEIKVARKADIESIQDPFTGIVYGDIVFLPDKGFVTWAVTPDTPGADSNSRQTREGTTKGNRLKFSVPKDRATIRAMFEKASDDELIVLYKDANGKQKIFGLFDAPVKFRFSHSSGNAPSGKNGYECEFYYEGPENMFEYNGAILAAPAGPLPSVVTFNGVVIASLQPGDTLEITSDYSFTEYFITTGP